MDIKDWPDIERLDAFISAKCELKLCRGNNVEPFGVQYTYIATLREECRLMRAALVFMTFLLIAASGQAATLQPGWQKVSQILTWEDKFGQCMIAIDGYSGSSQCEAGWATLDCQGSFLTKSIASRNLELAQIALALDRKIYTRIDESRKHNGYCLVYQMQLSNEG